jgi:hypothetical protein
MSCSTLFSLYTAEGERIVSKADIMSDTGRIFLDFPVRSWNCRPAELKAVRTG